MIKSIPQLFAAAGLLAVAASTVPVFAQCVEIENCQLVWSDEFNGTEVDPTRWSFMLGDGTEVGLPSGWGNGELQWYTDQNATVADGVLTITARKDNPQPGFQYSSARLRSIYKGDWTYGRKEMRARMPIGKGTWPAFWMLPTDRSYGGWAASGEIDIMEYIGSRPSDIFGTIHYGGEWPRNTYAGHEYTLPTGIFHDDFHVFAIEWEEGEIRWYMDDVHYGTATSWNTENGEFPAPFNVDFHLLLNLAVGGNLPGFPGSNTRFPQEYVIDYVRVYQQGEAGQFQINPGINDAWYNPATNGQGFLTTVFPETGVMFLAWFTFDSERPPEDATAVIGEPGQRWFTAQGTYQGDMANLTIFSSEGGVFDSAEPPVVTGQAGIGTMTVEFADCREGLITYEIPEQGLSGQIPIQRVVEDNVALCESLGASDEK